MARPKKVEPDPHPNPYICTLMNCNRMFIDSTSLMEHIKFKHVDGLLPMPAYLCLWNNCPERAKHTLFPPLQLAEHYCRHLDEDHCHRPDHVFVSRPQVAFDIMAEKARLRRMAQVAVASNSAQSGVGTAVPGNAAVGQQHSGDVNPRARQDTTSIVQQSIGSLVVGNAALGHQNNGVMNLRAAQARVASSNALQNIGSSVPSSATISQQYNAYAKPPSAQATAAPTNAPLPHQRPTRPLSGKATLDHRFNPYMRPGAPAFAGQTAVPSTGVPGAFWTGHASAYDQYTFPGASPFAGQNTLCSAVIPSNPAPPSTYCTDAVLPTNPPPAPPAASVAITTANSTSSSSTVSLSDLTKPTHCHWRGCTWRKARDTYRGDSLMDHIIRAHCRTHYANPYPEGTHEPDEVRCYWGDCDVGKVNNTKSRFKYHMQKHVLDQVDWHRGLELLVRLTETTVERRRRIQRGLFRGGEKGYCGGVRKGEV